MVDELIADRRFEEYRENIKAAFLVMEDKPRFLRVAAHAYVSMAKIWGLSPSQSAKLLDISISDFAAWQADVLKNLGAKELEKISCLLGIYRSLGTLYSGHLDRVSAWLLRSNYGGVFDGSTPYDLLET